MYSSNYTINSIWLSEQQAVQMCYFGGEHQRYLISMQYKIRLLWLDMVHFLQQSLHKTR